MDISDFAINTVMIIAVIDVVELFILLNIVLIGTVIDAIKGKNEDEDEDEN